MTLETRFTRLVGCKVPIAVAPMGALSTPALIAASNAAGAFGMVGTAGMNAEQAAAMVDAVLAATQGSIGANMLIPLLDVSVVEAVAPRVQLFDFYIGDPDRSLVDLVHDSGALASWQVGSVDEAKAAVDVGCDTISVRGIEGGGRMHGSQPLWPLLNLVLEAIDVPVLAAGGLATGRDLAAVLAAGADGARMGTRFVATDESGAHPIYKEALVKAEPTETVLSSDFSVLWPPGPQPARVLQRSIDAANALGGDSPGELMAFGERRALPKFAAPPPTADATGEIEAYAMYAGTSVYAIDRVEPAADIIRRLTAEAEVLLKSHAG